MATDKPQFPVSDVVVGVASKLEKPVRVKITLVIAFDADSLDDIAEIKEVIDEAADVLGAEGELIEEECKEEIIATT